MNDKAFHHLKTSITDSLHGGRGDPYPHSILAANNLILFVEESGIELTDEQAEKIAEYKEECEELWENC